MSWDLSEGRRRCRKTTNAVRSCISLRSQVVAASLRSQPYDLCFPMILGFLYIMEAPVFCHGQCWRLGLTALTAWQSLGSWRLDLAALTAWQFLAVLAPSALARPPWRPDHPWQLRRPWQQHVRNLEKLFFGQRRLLFFLKRAAELPAGSFTYWNGDWSYADTLSALFLLETATQ